MKINNDNNNKIDNNVNNTVSLKDITLKKPFIP